MRSRIFFKLLAVFVLVIAAAMVTLDFSVRSAWEKSLRQEIERNLTQKTVLFAHRVDTDRSHSLTEISAQEALAAGARATIIDPTGKVLADSEANPSSMENHGQRKEFVAALHGNVGSDERRSRMSSTTMAAVALMAAGVALVPVQQSIAAVRDTLVPHLDVEDEKAVVGAGGQRVAAVV